jgi:hypothetical protein
MSEQDRFAAAGMNVDYSEAERTTGRLPAPPAMMLPINGKPIQSLAGDGLIVCMAGEAPIAIVAIGNSGSGLGLHVRMGAGELRTMAANMLRAADLLDQGKGKQ